MLVLVIDKDKRRPGKVRFIDAKSFINSKSPREKVLNDYDLNDVIQGNNQNSDVVRIIDNHLIKEFDYNLNVPRYFQKHIEGVKLRDILEYYRGTTDDIPDVGKLIRIRDLKDDKVDFKLNVANVEETEFRRPSLRLIKESCLLLATRWKTLKPTLFEFSNTPIFLSAEILSFKVNKEIADTAYIINELHSDYVQEQLESYRLGAAIPMIRRDDLLEVVIKLPSLVEQRAKVQGIVELSDKIKLLQRERNDLAHGVGNKLYESVSTLKHSLGKPLLNIGSSLRNIEKALSRLNADWEQLKLNERYDITIKDSFESVYSNLDFIHSVLKNNETTLVVTNYKLEEIEFLNFIKGYVKRIKSAENSYVNTILDIHPDIKTQLNNNVSLKANTELLEIALNAIVENANMHAFTDQSKKYKLEFRVSLYVAPSKKTELNEIVGRFNTYIKLEVANNGKPFPKNYTLEKLTRKNSVAGETGNTGQGGYDLNDIIKYHNDGKSTLELITDDFTTEFTTIYSFLIPLNR